MDRHAILRASGSNGDETSSTRQMPSLEASDDLDCESRKPLPFADVMHKMMMSAYRAHIDSCVIDGAGGAVEQDLHGRLHCDILSRLGKRTLNPGSKKVDRQAILRTSGSNGDATLSTGQMPSSEASDDLDCESRKPLPFADVLRKMMTSACVTEWGLSSL
ncbi:hypothetical protein CBR_g26344 [Chara braunii]|uniref:Uncharacterized protein n=1 Tax=Chara braunii TaxID=69332 RepID=A0A388L7N7_CHABU|nr:hypothetical protein CBR_g26344 [Chara braunii]|eukprot:GBG78315.1 hypothetical protein CBR_g26344 [Chara braunii]